MPARSSRPDVFAALGDPNRRFLLQTLSERGEATATELAAELPVTRQAVTKHLTALADAGLVERERAGRETLYRVTPAPLEDAIEWMARVGGEWDARLARLMGVFGFSSVEAGAWLESRRPTYLMGTPDEVLQRVSEYEEAGLQRIMLQDWLPTDLDMLSLIGSEVLPHA